MALRGLEAPLFGWVLHCILRRGALDAPLLAPASTPRRTALSWLALAVLGTPTWAQWDALSSLPPGVAWPVWASSVLWFGISATLRAALAAPAPGGR